MPIKVCVPECELFDSKSQEFITTKGATLILEHSLISISKWEEKWQVPFIEGPNPKSRNKTDEQWLDYFRCMTISPKQVDPNVYRAIPAPELKRILEYIRSERTASYVSEEPKKGSNEQITSELIYFWMINYNVPYEFQQWHLSRLLMLIRICQRKTTPPKKQSMAERSLANARISAQRRSAAAKRKGK